MAAAEEAGDDGENDGVGRHAPFEIFVDPDGSLGKAALRERERLEAENMPPSRSGNPVFGSARSGGGTGGGGGGDENSNGGGGFDGRGWCDGGVGEDEENRENLGCPPNPSARNVRDPGVEAGVFRELEVPSAVSDSGSDADADADSDGDNDGGGGGGGSGDNPSSSAAAAVGLT
ncbi:unnamed protein product, partial [Ectocarpus fasciculatus]